MPSWTVVISSNAQKSVRRAPRHERERLLVELDRLAADPFSGNTVASRAFRTLPAAASATGGSSSTPTWSASHRRDRRRPSDDDHLQAPPLIVSCRQDAERRSG
jgi:hypothetical protein